MIVNIDSAARHKALAQELGQRFEREGDALLEIAVNGEAQVRYSPADEDRRFTLGYQLLLDTALERRCGSQTGDVSADARVFAQSLARQAGSPWELMEIHKETIESRCAGLAPDEVATVLDEARLVLLRVMGYLADAYRTDALSHAKAGNV